MSFRLVYLPKPITLVIRNGGSNCFALSVFVGTPSRHRHRAIISFAPARSLLLGLPLSPRPVGRSVGCCRYRRAPYPWLRASGRPAPRRRAPPPFFPLYSFRPFATIIPSRHRNHPPVNSDVRTYARI